MHPSFQTLLDTLEQEREALFSLLEFRSDKDLNHPPAPGTWSAIQVMHHLIISEELALQYLRKKLSFDPKFEKAGLRSRMRVVLLKFYLGLPFKFKAPEAVSGEALPAFVSLADTRARWSATRREMAAFLAEMPESHLDKELFKHPFAGKMTLEGMLEFFLTHFRRHREQIIRSF